MTFVSLSASSPPHGVQLGQDRSQWNVWAPRVARMELILLEGTACSVVPMREDLATGWFTCTTAPVPVGQRYLFRLDGERERPDPASRWQPDGVHGASAVWRADAFAWTDQSWRGVPLEELVLYELHVGTFTAAGTFDAVIPRLPQLRSLGVTAIELMPIGQFAGERGWGYDGTYWFAVQASYGGPAGLQRLIDACHAQGLAVILDVVYNHFGPEGNYLGDFGPCFTARHVTPWGDAVNYDDEGCEGMRSLVRDNVRQWFRDFHADGLRLDAVHAIHDDSQPHLLAEIGRVAWDEQRRSGRPLHVIAESNLNDAQLLDPPESGGHGLSAQWNDDFHHCVHTLLTGERNGYYLDFSDPPRQLVKSLNDVFVYDGAFSRYHQRPHGRPVGSHGGERFIVSVQTHDQVGNRALGERLSALVDPSGLRLAACLLLLAPHLPLLFMGEEYGEVHPFPFFADFGDVDLREAVRRGRREEFARFAWGDPLADPFDPATARAAELSWSWPAGTWQAGLRRLYQDLLSLRKWHPALRDYRHRAAQLTNSDAGQRLLHLRRGDSVHPLYCVFNLSDEPAPWPLAYEGLPVLLHSEDLPYTGDGEWDAPAERQWLRPRECIVVSLVVKV